MPVIKLTQEGISKLRCPNDKRAIQVCDAQFRGLLLEIRSKNPDRFTWYYRYKNDAAQTKYVKLGYFPDTSLLEARQLFKTEKSRVTVTAIECVHARNPYIGIAPGHPARTAHCES